MATTWGTWRAWAALVVALSACGSAHAFYFEGWPGSGTTPQPLTITPRVTAPLGEPVPVGPPVPVDKPPVGPGPTPTPEPATGLLGLLGFGALAARRWQKK
jgi:MYXO-CTERM domain-containing protein